MIDPAARRLLLAHFLVVIGEWSAAVGLLVHAHSWGGSSAVGLASVALLLPALLFAPLIASAISRWRAHAVRSAALGVQMLSFAGAAASASAGAPTPVVAAFTVVGLVGIVAIPPTSSALLPCVVGSTDELVSANLWMTHCDSSSALVGSLAAALVVGVGGPEAVFAAGALGSGVGLAATIWRPPASMRSTTATREARQRRPIARAAAELRGRPWSVGVLCVAAARNVIVGCFDVVLVIIAIDRLDLGEGGPGYLGALVGGGALISTFVTTSAVRRSKLSPALLTSVTVAGVLTITLGLRTERVVVFLALPLAGVCMATMNSLSRTLLQRSTDPRSLGPMFAALGMVASIGQLSGVGIAQVAIALDHPTAALGVLGALLLAVTAATGRTLRHADSHSEVPSVEMAVLANLPMLSALPTAGLEAVARSTQTITFEPGELVVAEGQRVDACFVVASGEFEITGRGAPARRARRGEAICDVALLTTVTSSSAVTALTRGSLIRIGRHPFLVALTGYDVDDSGDVINYESARRRFREVLTQHEHDRRATGADRIDSWLHLGATGRMLGDPSFTKAVSRGASLAATERDNTLLADAAAMTTWPGAFFFIAENPDQEMISVCEAALAVLPADEPMRARALATLASNLTFAAEPERRRAVIAEARRLAVASGDPALLGAVLNAEFICLWEPATLDRREAIAHDLIGIAEQTDDIELAYLGGFFAAYCATERGRLRDAREQLHALRSLLPATRNQYFEFLGDRLALAIDIALGEPGVQARIDALAERHSATYADTDGTWALMVGALAYQGGTLDTMETTIAAMVGGPHSRTWRAAWALALMVAGDREGAAKVLDEQGEVPRNYFWITVVQVQSEVAAALGLTDRCASLFEDLWPFRGTVGITASGSLCFGLVSRSLGELALALGRVDDARMLLAEAVTSADEIGMHFESVVARRLLARALHADGDREQATSVAQTALRLASEGGYAREVGILTELLSVADRSVMPP